jgi:two-component system response regulator LytT
MSETTTIKILIVEDELLIAEDIRMHLENMGYEVIGIASNYTEAIETAEKENPDIALVDVIIEGKIDGIQTADFLKSNLDIPVIFLTSHSDKATVDRAKSVKPDGYLVKPFNSNDLFTTIEIAFSNHANRSKSSKEQPAQTDDSFVLKDCIFIKKDYLLVKIKFEELKYIKSDGNYIEIYCDNKKLITRSTLKDFLLKLPSQRFVQVHKSYAVNIEHVDAIEYSNIIIGKESIPISRSFADELKKYIPQE